MWRDVTQNTAAEGRTEKAFISRIVFRRKQCGSRQVHSVLDHNTNTKPTLPHTSKHSVSALKHKPQPQKLTTKLRMSVIDSRLKLRL